MARAMASSQNDEMNFERWQRAKDLLNTASEMAPADREIYLAAACGQDESLYREVKSLLDSLDQAGEFLAGPPASPGKLESLPATAPVFSVGDRISERYQILEFIGRGGMGEVYKAMDYRLAESIALKMIRPEVLSEHTIARFRQEVLLGRRVTHPNVCRVFDLEQHVSTASGSQIVFLTMEFLKGETLRTRLKREHSLPLNVSLDVIAQIAAALAASHAAGVIHRDLKPSNVILSGHRAVVTDFGVARLADGRGRSEHTLTGSNEIIGTFDYMAPEQIESGQIGPATDIYALGLILYEMLTGQKPFSGETRLSSLAQRVKGSVVSPRTYVKELDSTVESLILACLAVDPAQRIQDAALITHTLSGQRTPADRSRGQVSFSTPAKCSIVVLPFANMAPDPENEYFSDGLTEELIGALNRVDGLRVVARTSAFRYRNQAVDIRQVARELNIDVAIEGAVRRSGDRLRVSVQLVNATDGYHLWSDRYDRKLQDVFAVQEEIANTVAVKLQMKLRPEQEFVQHRTQNVEAYNSFLKGRFFSSQRTPSSLRKAADCFQLSLQQDPQFAPALAAWADCLVVQGVYGIRLPQDVFPLAKEIVFKALSLGPQLAEAHGAAGCIQAIYDWDWASAERSFHRALEQDPNFAAAYHSYAHYCLIPQGRFAEARSQIERALANDPLSLAINVSLAVQSYFERCYDRAIQECEKVLQMDANFGMAWFFMGQAYEQKNMYAEATGALERAVVLTERSVEALAWLGRACARSGEERKARSLLDELNALASRQYVSPVLLAALLLGLGESKAALDRLETACNIRAADLIWIGVRPAFDQLRSELQFQEISRRIGLLSTSY